MLGLLNQGVKTFRQYGLKVFFTRVFNYAIFKIKRVVAKKDKENLKKFSNLKGKYKGKRIFIIGNGPSLNEMPLYLLKDEYKMCFNRFALMEERVNWFPDFYAVTDDLVLKDQAKELNENIIPRVKAAFFPDIHPSNLSIKKIINDKKNVLWLHVDKPDFSDNLPDCGINKTVVNAGIQIAAYMGFTDIYLIGVDMTFGEHKITKSSSRNWKSEGDDTNHFDPRYFGKGRSYHNPGVDEMLQKFELCKAFFDSRNVRIFNAGYGGKLETFPRVKFTDIINVSDEKAKEYFLSALHTQNPNISLDNFIEFNEKNADCDFVTSTENGTKLIKEYIFSHVPIGPYKGKYYFIKRYDI